LSASSEDRFRELFFEEARELLISLEEGLMDLERRQSDRAHLDKTFRAAHTLKGAAAMVGLAVIAEFTNGIEAVLDRIRAGALAVDSEIITTLLEARDHLAAMVEADAARSPIPPSGELTQRLTALLRGPGGNAPGATGGAAPRIEPPAAAPPVAPADSAAEQSPAPAGKPRPKRGSAVSRPRTKKSAQPPGGEPRAPSKPRSRRTTVRGMGPSPSPHDAVGPGEVPNHGQNEYRLTLAPGPDVLRRGINPLGVLDELRELGEATLVTDHDAVPMLDQLDPERCYLSWKITIKTDAGLDRLGEAFLFFTEDSTITIERRTADGRFVRVPGVASGGAAAVVGTTAGGAVTTTEARPTSANFPATTVLAAPTSPAAIQPPAPTLPPVAASATPARGAASSLPAAARAHSRIRVDAAQLDDLVGLAGELVVVTDNLMGLREIRGVETWVHALEALQRVSRQIRDTTLDLRMVPVDELFSRFPRVVRDLADRSGKEIELRIVGQETRLDRTIVERLSDPMIHLIRNAVDHALEHPVERLEKGKPRVGRITLSAGHEGDRVAIRVEDDGRGLDRERIVRKGIALGMVPTGTSPDDPRVVGLIFEPGFSTRDTVSELSGRGVGLDVVRDAVRGLRGTVAVESSPGKGTAFIFRLPLTLALIDGLLVETGDGRYVVPLAQVEECVALNGTRSALAEARPCVAVRGELVPIVSLRNLFRANGSLPARQELLLTRHAGQRVGIAVDRLVGRVQAVIQSLGEGLHGLNRFSGATILGDGSVSLILDLSALVSESRFAEHSARQRPLGGPEGGD
jgi:two-component system, chemotaxis family, sensor kinase CheA